MKELPICQLGDNRNEWMPSVCCHLDVLHRVERKREEWNGAKWNRSYFHAKCPKHLSTNGHSAITCEMLHPFLKGRTKQIKSLASGHSISKDTTQFLLAQAPQISFPSSLAVLLQKNNLTNIWLASPSPHLALSKCVLPSTHWQALAQLMTWEPYAVTQAVSSILRLSIIPFLLSTIPNQTQKKPNPNPLQILTYTPMHLLYTHTSFTWLVHTLMWIASLFSIPSSTLPTFYSLLKSKNPSVRFSFPSNSSYDVGCLFKSNKTPPTT